MNDTSSESAFPNAQRLLWAGFTAILAAGVGFALRGGILGLWAEEFGFTMTELGTITGGGLTGFGIVIILSSLIADKVGYGRLMMLAFVLHVVSAVVTLAAPAAFESGGKEAAYNCLFWGMFLFAVANGLAETVVNPLTATLFPKAKTHYLNILHAGWPAGLVLGGLASAFMGAQAIDWKIQMSLFLIPVIIYGILLFGQKFPQSEAASAGTTIGEMVGTVFAPLMLFLLLLHAMVGYVELGTDSWIANITGSIMASGAKGMALFVYTSTLMFALRFVAGPIVHRISPLGLLCLSSVLGFLGLTLLSNASSVAFCVIAATVYACGKTFLWPTMLAVASERFPKGGAVAIGMMGGVGMLSAGLLGGPAIGFKQDYFASQQLETDAPETFERYKADEPGKFMGYETAGLNGAKVSILADDGKELARVDALLEESGKMDENQEELSKWWDDASKSAETDKALVSSAGLFGGRMALKLTSYVPLIMAVCYLILIVGFKISGGYKPVHLDEQPDLPDEPEALGTGES